MASNYPISVQEVFRGVVSKAESYVLDELKAYNDKIEGIHYRYSTYKEMNLILSSMAQSSMINLRFPLVWLSESPPIPQTRNGDGFFADVTLQVWIMFHTERNYTSEQREQYVFAPILRPIYWALMRAITFSSEFGQPSERNIRNTFLEHKYLGTNDQAANMFSSFVDAIEIQNLELTLDYKNCITPLILN